MPAATRWPIRALIPEPCRPISARSINSTTRYAALAPRRFKNIRGEGVARAPRRSKIRTMVSTGVPTLAPRFVKLILENFP